MTTSIFIFESGVPQDEKQFFACYMESDGLVTVKNKGRHDVHGKGPAIEDYWVDVVEKQSGDPTCQWIDPKEHLSYQVPPKPFSIREEDFQKTALDYLLWQKNVNVSELREKLMGRVMYGSELVDADERSMTIKIGKGEE